uniref:Uncharacterized protein n=1 Tax=Trypanosoma congolense (strain IL3000) TaxID=1068625 RepID=G0UKZ4_TRYCI|nr:hypothetical protein, unlikely [Trypanosoma congolense IL3000]
MREVKQQIGTEHWIGHHQECVGREGKKKYWGKQRKRNADTRDTLGTTADVAEELTPASSPLPLHSIHLPFSLPLPLGVYPWTLVHKKVLPHHGLSLFFLLGVSKNPYTIRVRQQ